MKVEDLRPKGAGWELRLHEKGGKHHVMPCHHSLAEALRAYIDAAGIAEVSIGAAGPGNVMERGNVSTSGVSGLIWQRPCC